MRFSLILSGFWIIWFCSLAGTVSANYTNRADIEEYIEVLVSQHNFSHADLLDIFEQVEKKQSIINAISRPAERSLRWHEYRDIFLGDRRVDEGVVFWKSNRSILSDIQRKYGVPAEYIVAILGVETNYGQNMGGYRVLDALTTLAFDYPPRATFFRKELTEFLLLAREEKFNPLELVGSYAGAMGFGQFMPSSFRAYAVDFDQDGRRDIWGNLSDALGSVANYLLEHGWVPGQNVAARAYLLDPSVSKIANKGLKPTKNLEELVGMGIESRGFNGYQDRLSQHKASLYRMEIRNGVEYWIGFNNFYAITRYNHSRLYALAVHQLSQKILEQFYIDEPTD
tara:strand:+ start:73 stop:1092 length:1020 start_codon:yes stop_codon:yes gene_type:complete